MTPSLLAVLLTTAPVAHAQDAFGVSPGAQSGGLLDAPTTATARGPRSGAAAASLLVDHSLEPLQVCTEGAEIDPEYGTCTGRENTTPWLRSHTGLFLAGAYGLSPRLSLGGDAALRLPAALSEGSVPALSGADASRLETASVFGQVGLLDPARPTQVALQARGHLDPDGDPTQGDGDVQASWLYGPGSGASASLVVSRRAIRTAGEVWPRFQVTGDATYFQPLGDATERSTLPSAPFLRGRAAGAFRVHPNLAVLTELEGSIGGVAESARAEVRAGVRWRARDRLEVLGLLGHSPTLTMGAPLLRVMAGIRVVPGAPKAVAFPAREAEIAVVLRDTEGVLLSATVGGDLAGLEQREGPNGELILVGPATGSVRVELEAAGTATWTETLTLEGTGPWRVERVLPAGGGQGTLDLSLFDVDGNPVDEARVALGDQDLGTVCGRCDVVLSGLPEDPLPLAVRAPTFAPLSSTVTPAAADASDLRPGGVYLTRPPGSVHLAVRDAAGPRPDAEILLIRATGTESVALDKDGEVWLTLDPGRFRVRVTADGMGAQERTLQVAEDDLHLHDLAFQLFPAATKGARLSVEAVSAEGSPVEGAEVRLDDQTLGVTGSGGQAIFEDLDQGDAELTVVHPWFRDYPEQPIALTPGTTTELLAPLSWLPGQVSVAVTDGDALPVDATVRVERNGQLEAVDRTGPDGQLHASLEPGAYQLTLTAPGRTAVTLDLEVTPQRDEALLAEAVLAPRSAEGTALALTVLDKLDQPVEGASVFLDSTPVGTTTTGGRLSIDGIETGDRRLRVTGEFYDPWRGELRAEQENTATTTARLKERLGVVTVAATTESGTPVDAFVRLLGPVRSQPRRLGADGVQKFRLAEGFWEVLYSNELHGLYATDLGVDREQSTYEVRWTTPDVQTPTPLAPLPRRTATVSLRSRADDQPVAGTLRLLGPEVLAPVEVGEQGTWTGDLRLGWWEMLATAEALGIGGGDLQVTEAGPDPSLRIDLGEARVEVTDQQVEISEAIYFETDSAVLRGRSSSLLEEVARTLRARPEIKRVRIEGHTDAQGTAAHNLDLSRRRAAAVRASLVDRGVERRRLETQGFGDAQPVDSNDTEAGRAANRRVVFQVLRVRESSVAEPQGGDETTAAEREGR